MNCEENPDEDFPGDFVARRKAGHTSCLLGTVPVEGIAEWCGSLSSWLCCVALLQGPPRKSNGEFLE